GRFRADLFYRLNTFPIDLPPLSERPEDVLPLARHFLKQFVETMGRALGQLTPEAETALKAYAWPGNVRELRNTMERAALLSPPGPPIGLEALPKQIARALPRSKPLQEPGASLKGRLDSIERELIQTALIDHGGVVRQAALALGINPVTLRRKMRHHGL